MTFKSTLDAVRRAVAGAAGQVSTRLAPSRLDFPPIWSRGSAAGVVVTPQSAMGLTAVYCAINRISGDFAVITPELREFLPRGGTRLVEDHPSFLILNRRPDPTLPGSNALRFRRAQMAQVLGWGNSYAEILRDGHGYPVAMRFLPVNTQPGHNDSGAVIYRVPGRDKPIPAANVFHFAGLSRDGLLGLSPLDQCIEAIAIGLASQTYASSYYATGGTPELVFKHKTTNDDEQIDDFLKRFRARRCEGNKFHEPIVLPPDWDMDRLTVNPDVAQLIATRSFQVAEVARMFNMPPNKLQDLSSAHFANVEQSDLDYYKGTMTPWFAAWEAEADDKLLLAGEFETRSFTHNLDRYTRGDTAARTDRAVKYVAAGILSVDEVREEDGYAPLGPEKGGDKHLAPLNSTTLEHLGDPAPPAA